MHFLGLSALAHDTAAALLGDTGFLAAIEESKLTRSRNSSGIPREAIRFCIDHAAIGWSDVRAIAVASRPWQSWVRRSWMRARYLPLSPISSSYYESKFLGDLARELNNLRILRLLSGDAQVPVFSFDHHLCHAASAFYASPFERAVVLTMDEQGDGLSGMIAIGEGDKLRVEHSIPFPHSLAWVYSQVTELLGYRPREHEHKTQWLSQTAEPAFAEIFLRMLRSSPSLYPRLDSRYFQRGYAGQLAFSSEFYRQTGIALHSGKEMDDKTRAALASSLEHACEVVVAELVQSLRKHLGIANFCLAGGLFLNPLLVSAIEEASAFDNVFVQPAAGNEGTALGAAFLACAQSGTPRVVNALPHIYLGPRYSNDEIKAVLDNCKASYRWLSSDSQKIEETRKLLLAGKIVGWFDGPAEFGPRALGNRSLLASPWAPYVKENLNDYVKHREPFRPFALSVPEEDAAKYFIFSPPARFMANMSRVRPEHRARSADYLLPRDRVRLHVVAPGVNPLFTRLLQRFGEQAPAPVLLNTSFNLFGEPLVLSPRHAVRSYFCSGVDALVIGSFLLVKS
jgi:carbamoyltransferase